MRLLALDHVNIHTEDVERLASWYEETLGMKVGPRPNSFDFDGAWLYIGDQPIIHLVGAADVQRPETPALEHFSVTATGLRELLDRFEETRTDYQLVDVPDVDVVQVNIRDCDGNHIHIDFPLTERSWPSVPA